MPRRAFPSPVPESVAGVARARLGAWIALPFALALVGGCGDTLPDPEADRAAVLEVGNRAVAALNAGDIDGFLTLWTEDAILMPPGEPIQLGKERMRRGIEAFYRNWTVDMRTRVTDVWLSGDMAVVYGANIGAVHDRRSERVDGFDRKFLWVLRRQETGRWAIALEINNRNGPGAAGSAR